MRLRAIILLMALSVLGAVAVGILFSVSPRSIAGGGFVRTYLIDDFAKPEDTLDLTFNSFYLAGSTEHTLFLGNRVAAFNATSIDVETMSSRVIPIEVLIPDTLLFKGLTLKVDSPFFYVADGFVPLLAQGTFQLGTASPLQLDRNYFIDFVPIDKEHIVFKSLWSGQDTRLGLFTTSSPRLVFSQDVLERQVDGVFCVDGAFHSYRGGIVYVYYYRNEYILVDSLLERVDRRRTIDSMSRAVIKTAEFDDGSTRSYRGTIPYVNRKSYVAGDLLYICSGVPADNDRKEFSTASVIDVYDLRYDSYLWSFRIPFYGDKPLTEFAVAGDFLFARFIDKLMKFRMTPPSTMASKKSYM